MADESLRGRLLVATPALTDPHFFRTVVLVIEHNDDGAAGLVLNRPSDTALAEAVPAWSAYAAAPPVVFVGGPVAPEVAVGLAVGGLVVDLAAEPAAVDGVRIFAGYAGWGAGQLEWELGLDSWFVVDAEPYDVLAPEPERLWQAVLRRQRGPLAWFAGYPDDPTLN